LVFVLFLTPGRFSHAVFSILTAAISKKKPLEKYGTTQRFLLIYEIIQSLKENVAPVNTTGFAAAAVQGLMKQQGII
jgi:hypothetical protein